MRTAIRASSADLRPTCSCWNGPLYYKFKNGYCDILFHLVTSHQLILQKIYQNTVMDYSELCV